MKFYIGDSEYECESDFDEDYVFGVDAKGKVHYIERHRIEHRGRNMIQIYESEKEANREASVIRAKLQPPPPPPPPEKPHPLTNMYHGKPTDADWRRRPDGTYNNRPNDPDYYKNYMKNYKNDKVQCDICRSVLVSRNLERHKRISKNCLKIKNILEQQTV